MPDLELPARLGDLTAAWLTAALQAGGGVPAGAEVTSFVAEPIGVGVGLLGELARLRLEWAPAGAGPASVVAKVPSAHEANRAQGMMFGFYERESRLYAEVLAGDPLRTPRVWFDGHDPQAERFILLIEDLGHLEMGDQVAGLTAERAHLAVQTLAPFHARWWDAPQLDALEWLPYGNGPITMQATFVYQRDWPPFLEKFGHDLPPGGREAGDRILASFDWLLNQLGERPLTITHTDFRLDNLFFGPPGTPDACAVIDWQLTTRSRGTYDVAYLLSQSLSVEERRRSEQDIVRGYLATLEEHGVTGYGWDACWRDYLLGGMICTVIPVSAGGNLDLANERGIALVGALTQRSFAAVLDHSATELLP